MDRLTHRDNSGEAYTQAVDDMNVFAEPQCRYDERGMPVLENFAKEMRGSVVDRLAQYEDTGVDPEEIKRIQETLVTAQRLKKEQYDTLEKYLKAEAEGRLVIFPVNIGDDVYYLTSAPSLAAGKPTRVEKSKCRGFYFDNKGIQICLDYDVQGSHGTYGWWGKTIFATRTEAEAALKGISNGD